MSVNMLEFEFDQKIDPMQLDIESVRQAELYFKWSERAVEAKGHEERLKLHMETVKSEIELKVRKRPEKYKLQSATEAAVKATVATQPKYLKAVEEYFSARDDARLLEKAEKAMEIRKRMLEVLATLHGHQYFAGPSAPRDLKEVWLAQKQAADSNLNERQKGKGRKRKKKKKRIKVK